MSTIAPFSPLNLFQLTPAKPVKSGGGKTVSALNQLSVFSSQNDFATEQKLARLSTGNYTMARANNSSTVLQLFSDSNSKQAIQNSMNALLQEQYLPSRESSDMASFAKPADQQKLAMYKSLSGGAGSGSLSLIDLLKV